MNEPHCPTCHWYRALTYRVLDGGVCRRHPPAADESTGLYRGWPKVDCGDYCGEYQDDQAQEQPIAVPRINANERRQLSLIGDP